MEEVMALLAPVLLAITALILMIGQFFRPGNAGFWIAALSGVLAMILLYLTGRGMWRRCRWVYKSEISKKFGRKPIF